MMYRLDISLPTYESMKQRLSEIHPEIELELIVCDYALVTLGFVKDPPCIVHVDLTEEAYNDLMTELMDFEIAAYNQPESERHPEKTPVYQQYLRYGWMWDYFYWAKIWDGSRWIPLDDEGEIT